jgi:hypothetical protein
MIKMLDIILEGSYDAQGVGDKAYERFNISTTGQNEKAVEAMKKDEGERPVGYVNGVSIYLNPKSLELIGPSSRAIGDIKGNLYVPQKDGSFIHEDIATALGIDIYDERYIRLVRLGRTKIFGAFSNFGKDRVNKILKALEHRNPQYQFKAGM